MADRRRGLGRGFESLIPTDVAGQNLDRGDEAAASADSRSGTGVTEVAVGLLDPNPHQPRTTFEPEALEALAASIRVHGILQPLVVTRAGDRYQLIAGERRLRSAKLAGLATVPVIVRSFDEQQKLELALIENVQRADLNPLEVAAAYRKLVDEFNLSIGVIAERVGRNPSTVSNTMRLLNLVDEVKEALRAGKISEGMARAILSVVDPDKQREMLHLVFKHRWSTPQAEDYARGYKGEVGNKQRAMARMTADSQLTMDLGGFLGAKVTQQRLAKGGRLIIEYYSEEELNRIYRIIRHEEEV